MPVHERGRWLWSPQSCWRARLEALVPETLVFGLRGPAWHRLRDKISGVGLCAHPGTPAAPHRARLQEEKWVAGIGGGSAGMGSWWRRASPHPAVPPRGSWQLRHRQLPLPVSVLAHLALAQQLQWRLVLGWAVEAGFFLWVKLLQGSRGTVNAGDTPDLRESLSPPPTSWGGGDGEHPVSLPQFPLLSRATAQRFPAHGGARVTSARVGKE